MTVTQTGTPAVGTGVMKVARVSAELYALNCSQLLSRRLPYFF